MKNLVLVFSVMCLLVFASCGSTKTNPYKKRVHHGVPSTRDKATKKNEKFKKKNSKAAPNSSTKAKEHKKKVAKTKHRNSFNHH